MNDQTEQQLLHDYAAYRSEAAFAELVRRHVDLVYSAAMRMVRDAHLAQDVTQATFVALAQNAQQLTNHAVLSGWLHRTAQNLASKTVRTDVRRRAREQEAVAMNELLSAHSEVSWEQIAPHLDTALSELSEPERDAVILRYFEKKSAAEIGSTIGISSEAAQKRVSRAVERLREFFAKRGVSVGAGGLVVVISANAVQAAPVGLAVTISAAALAGTAATTSTLIAATTKTIAMTTLQKTLVTATVAVLAGAGIYEARQAAQLRDQVHTLQQQQAPLSEQLRQLQRALSEASNLWASVMAENKQIRTASNQNEVLRLRGQIGVLQNQLAEAKSGKPPIQQPALATAREYCNRADRHRSNREYEAALDDLTKAIELDPNLSEAYQARADLYVLYLPAERGGDKQALLDETRCLELNPRDAIARWSRANRYRVLQRYDEAIADWGAIIDGEVDFSRFDAGKTKTIASALAQRGEIFQYNKKEYAKAIADYTAAIQMNPNIEGLNRFMGECYTALGDPEKAKQYFEKAIK